MSRCGGEQAGDNDKAESQDGSGAVAGAIAIKTGFSRLTLLRSVANESVANRSTANDGSWDYHRSSSSSKAFDQGAQKIEVLGVVVKAFVANHVQVGGDLCFQIGGLLDGRQWIRDRP